VCPDPCSDRVAGETTALLDGVSLTNIGWGVVCEGSVGLPLLGRSRFFRYEVRRWRDDATPDVAEAVASPQRLSANRVQAQRWFELVPDFPTATWGRDERHTGEMGTPTP
jgi:hypothetical protein